MSWDPVWEDIFKRQPWGKYPCVDLIRFVARNFYQAQDRKIVRLLEVGCGPGANLWFIAREGFSVYGIDGSDTAIREARRRLDSECPGWTGELITSDIGKLPYPDGFFDGVIDVEAIYSNPYQYAQGVYSELARVTRTGGKIFTLTFAVGSWGDGTGENVGHNAWLASEGPLAAKGFSRFTALAEIEDLVAGFQVEEVELSTRSMDNRRHEVKEWAITGVKL
jgi:SAM-dependent methyltransferase